MKLLDFRSLADKYAEYRSMGDDELKAMRRLESKENPGAVREYLGRRIKRAIQKSDPRLFWELRVLQTLAADTDSERRDLHDQARELLEQLLLPLGHLGRPKASRASESAQIDQLIRRRMMGKGGRTWIKKMGSERACFRELAKELAAKDGPKLTAGALRTRYNRMKSKQDNKP